MQLNIQNFTAYVSSMAAAMQGAATAALDLTVGSVLRAIIEATVALGLWLQWLIVQVLAVTRLATSSGTDCDTFGADFGYVRIAGTASSGPAVFGRSSATAATQLPVGTIVKTLDGTQSFVVNVDTTNPAYQVDPSGATQGWFVMAAGVTQLTVTVTNTAVGSVGNVLAGSIGLIASVNPPPGINTVTNTVAFTNGTDAQSDASFKAGFANFISTRALGTLAAILYAISQLGANITSSVAEFVNASGAYAPGNFVVYADDGSGDPPSGTIQNISVVVNNTRALGIQYAVLGPQKVTAAIAGTITVATGSVKATAVAAAEAAVIAYINGLAMGVVLPYSRLSAIIYGASSSITNISDLTLNGGTADLGGASNQVVRAGAITFE